MVVGVEGRQRFDVAHEAQVRCIDSHAEGDPRHDDNRFVDGEAGAHDVATRPPRGCDAHRRPRRRECSVPALGGTSAPWQAGAMSENPTNTNEATPAARTFAWSDMFVAPEDDPRSQAPTVGERATVLGYLTAYRQTLELKCQGLDAEQMARRSVPPSNLSLLGLVRHLADVERYWFRQVLAGQDAPRRYRTASDHNADFNDSIGDPAVVAEAWASWREEIAAADATVDGFADLGATVPHGDGGVQVAVREVLVHMIEEYARHCGHADLLRERIDGRVGQ